MEYNAKDLRDVARKHRKSEESKSGMLILGLGIGGMLLGSAIHKHGYNAGEYSELEQSFERQMHEESD